MSIAAITGLVEVGKGLIDKFFPDPAQKAEALFKLKELEKKGDLEDLKAYVTLMTGQIEINKIDAQSRSKFQSWWRPSIGWVGAISLALMYIPKALVMTYIWTYQALVILAGWDGISTLSIPSFPDLGVSDIIGLLMSMLGVAAMRSYDKTKNVDTK